MPNGKNMKSELRLLRNSVKNPKRFKFYKKRYLFEKSFGKKPVISYVPGGFNIGITFRCNFRCPACTFLLRDQQAFDVKQDMSLEEFNWILEKFKGSLVSIGLTGGEPTLHPQFSEIVRSAKKRGLKLVMPTNGTMLKQRINDLEYFDKINISIDGVDFQNFSKVRGGSLSQFNDVIEGVRLMREKKIPFRISFLLFEENLSEAGRILAFAEEMKPERLQFESGNPHGSPNWTPLKADSPAVRNFLEEIFQRDDYPFSIRMPIIFDPNSLAMKKQSCPQLWANAVVGQRGDIAFCCHLKDRPEIGNIFKDYNFNSPLMVEFRKAMIEGRYPVDCLFCKNRFFNNFACSFEATKKKWEMTPAYRDILLKINLLPKNYA